MLSGRPSFGGSGDYFANSSIEVSLSIVYKGSEVGVVLQQRKTVLSLVNGNMATFEEHSRTYFNLTSIHIIYI